MFSNNINLFSITYYQFITSFFKKEKRLLKPNFLTAVYILLQNISVLNKSTFYSSTILKKSITV